MVDTPITHSNSPQLPLLVKLLEHLPGCDAPAIRKGYVRVDEHQINVISLEFPQISLYHCTSRDWFADKDFRCEEQFLTLHTWFGYDLSDLLFVEVIPCCVNPTIPKLQPIVDNLLWIHL